MIDYVKIQIKNPDIDFLLKNTDLTFYREISEETSEYKSKQVAEYHFCKITIYDSGTVLFTGSIHKLLNSIKGVLPPNYNSLLNRYKGYNGNDFTLKNLYEVKNHLQRLFNCKPKQMVLRNIEIGVNLSISFDPGVFLKGLLYQKGKPFENSYNRNYYQVKHQQYLLKLYDKGKQYGMGYNSLRVELKFLRMQEMNTIGIFTLEDINYTILNKAREVLLKRFDEVVYYDKTIRKNKLSTNEKKDLKNYKNPRYWIDDLKPQHRDRHKKKLQKLINYHSKKLHSKIRHMIIKKCVMINQDSFK